MQFNAAYQLRLFYTAIYYLNLSGIRFFYKFQEIAITFFQETKDAIFYKETWRTQANENLKAI